MPGQRSWEGRVGVDAGNFWLSCLRTEPFSTISHFFGPPGEGSGILGEGGRGKLGGEGGSGCGELLIELLADGALLVNLSFSGPPGEGSGILGEGIEGEAGRGGWEWMRGTFD